MVVLQKKSYAKLQFWRASFGNAYTISFVISLLVSSNLGSLVFKALMSIPPLICGAKAAEVLPRDDYLNREAEIGAVTGLGVLYRNGKPIGGDTILIQVRGSRKSPGLEVTGGSP